MLVWIILILFYKGITRIIVINLKLIWATLFLNITSRYMTYVSAKYSIPLYMFQMISTVRPTGIQILFLLDYDVSFRIKIAVKPARDD